MRNPRLGLRAAAVLIGMLLLLIAYYWVHKPVTPQSLSALAGGVGALFSQPVEFGLLLTNAGGGLLDLLTVFAIFALSGAVGRVVLRLLRVEADLVALSAREMAALAALIGSGVLATLILGAALLGWLNVGLLWGGAAVLAALIWRDGVAWVRGLAAQAPKAERGGAVVVGLVGLFLLTALLIAAAPPYAWDSMVYHLVGPQRYLESGRMIAYADNFYLGFPKSAEMLFVLGMSAFGRDTPPALLHWGFGLLALILTMGIVRRAADVRSAWLAALLLLASYNLWELMGWGYVDLTIMAYAAACFALLLLWRDSSAPRLLVTIGLLIGLATGVKFTSAFLAAGVGVYVLLRAPRRVLHHALLISLPALIAVLPWLLRAWALYGNPIYPLLGFGLNWDVERANAFTRAGWGMWGTPDAWQLAFLPLTATIFGYNLGPNTSFTLGPFLLTAALLLPICWRWLDATARATARDSLILAVPMVALWTYMAATSNTGEQTRLVIALLPLGAISGALAFYGLSRMPRKPVAIGFLVRFLFILTCLLAALEVVTVTFDRRPLAYFAGQVDRAAYLENTLGVWGTAMQRLDALPDGSQVRMLWELRTYHCPPTVTCIPDIMLDQWAYPLRQGQTEAAIFESWRAAGDDYLLVYDLGYLAFTEGDTYHRAENLRFPAPLAAQMTPVWTVEYLQADGTPGAAYTLYTWGEE